MNELPGVNFPVKFASYIVNTGFAQSGAGVVVIWEKKKRSRNGSMFYSELKYDKSDCQPQDPLFQFSLIYMPWQGGLTT